MATLPVPALDAIPAQLRTGKRFVCGDANKAPLRPSGAYANVTAPTTWTTAATAHSAALRRGWLFGRVLADGDELVCVDVDKLLGADGAVQDAEIAAFVARWQAVTWTERSISGTGLHLWFTGELPEQMRNRKSAARPSGAAIEIWTHSRWIAMTGDIEPETPTTLAEVSAELVADIERLMAIRKPQAKPQPQRLPQQQQRPQSHPTHYPHRLDINEQAIIERLQRHPRLSDLWRGDASSYGGDESSRDFALCCELAKHTNCDALVMARLFEQSGCMRDKWHSPRGDSTYGEHTISAAITKVQSRIDDIKAMPTEDIEPHLQDAGAAQTSGFGTGAPAMLAWLAVAFDRAETFRQRAVAAEAQNERLWKVLSSNQSGAEKLTALSVMADAEQRGATKAGDVLAAPCIRHAERTGQSEPTVGRHYRELERQGLVRLVPEQLPAVLDESGNIVKPPRTMTRLELLADIEQWPDLLSAERERPKNGHGGKRYHCTSCGSENVIKQTTIVCGDCATILHHSERPMNPPADAEPALSIDRQTDTENGGYPLHLHLEGVAQDIEPTTLLLGGADDFAALANATRPPYAPAETRYVDISIGNHFEGADEHRYTCLDCGDWLPTGEHYRCAVCRGEVMTDD